jgi:hypothetical protein
MVYVVLLSSGAGVRHGDIVGVIGSFLISHRETGIVAGGHFSIYILELSTSAYIQRYPFRPARAELTTNIPTVPSSMSSIYFANKNPSITTSGGWYSLHMMQQSQGTTSFTITSPVAPPHRPRRNHSAINW